MPKIFEYLGILFFFYSNEHAPIHVHARKGEFESKAEFTILGEEIVSIRITNVRGREPLSGNELKDLKVFLESYAEDIVKKWNDYFLNEKSIKFERITKRIR